MQRPARSHRPQNPAWPCREAWPLSRPSRCAGRLQPETLRQPSGPDTRQPPASPRPSAQHFHFLLTASPHAPRGRCGRLRCVRLHRRCHGATHGSAMAGALHLDSPLFGYPRRFLLNKGLMPAPSPLRLTRRAARHYGSPGRRGCALGVGPRGHHQSSPATGGTRHAANRGPVGIHQPLARQQRLHAAEPAGVRNPGGCG